MKTFLNYEAIADYLSNAIDRDSDEEMVEFLAQEFGIEKSITQELVHEWLKRFSKQPIIMMDEAVFFLVKQLE